MELTINSKRLGRKITFSRPGNGYIFVDLNGMSGTLGRQICDGGGMYGSTISYHGNDHNEFKRICRNWWNAFLRHTDEYI